jgi:hypothetical protein
MAAVNVNASEGAKPLAKKRSSANSVSHLVQIRGFRDSMSFQSPLEVLSTNLAHKGFFMVTTGQAGSGGAIAPVSTAERGMLA